MFKINHNVYWLDLTKFFKKKVNLFVDDFTEPPKEDINIFFVCEPQSVTSSKQRIINNCHKYNTILTYNTEILNNCGNAELFEFGMSWIKNLEETYEKRFEISFLVGGKSFLTGHKLRHEVWLNQNSILNPKNFFNSSSIPFKTNINSKLLGDKKEPLFESQFHICIENSQEVGYFSEKLIDCLYTKTIPIYWGCPNISDYFNLDSIFVVNSIDEILNICNNLKNNTYQSKLKSINENFEKSLKFVNISERIEKKIDEIVNR